MFVIVTMSMVSTPVAAIHVYVYRPKVDIFLGVLTSGLLTKGVKMNPFLYRVDDYGDDCVHHFAHESWKSQRYDCGGADVGLRCVQKA